MFDNLLNFFGVQKYYRIFTSEYETLLEGFGGTQFAKGLFTIIDKKAIKEWENRVFGMFPSFKETVKVFAYDWRGRCFSIDVSNDLNSHVIMFDPGTVKSYEIPLNLLDFLNIAVPGATKECLDSDLFVKWYKKEKSVLLKSQCVGFKTPLFLGGEDKLSNIEVSDIDVYWYLMTQIYEQVQSLEEGTVIGSFTVD